MLSPATQAEGEVEGEGSERELDREEGRERHMLRPTAHGEGEERKSRETSDGDRREGEDTGEERRERGKDESGEEWRMSHLFRPADQDDGDGDRWEERERNERVMLRPTTLVEGEASEREGGAERPWLIPASQHERGGRRREGGDGDEGERR